MRRSRAVIQAELDEARERLKVYLDREREMMSTDGVQSYTIGSRSLSRYQTNLPDVLAMIDQLKKRIRELEAELAGQSPRRAVRAVPRDW